MFYDSFSFEDTWTCPGITIVQSNEERDTIIEFSPTRLWIQRHGVATLTANGKTLTSNFSAMIFEDASAQQVKVVGTVYNIQVRAVATCCSMPARSSSISRRIRRRFSSQARISSSPATWPVCATTWPGREHRREENGHAQLARLHRHRGPRLSLATLAAAAASARATLPVENGQIVFRRYLDVGRTTGAIFTANADGSGVKQVTRPSRGVIDQYPDLSPDGKTIVFHRMVPCPAGGSKDGMDGTCDRVYTVGRDGRGLKPLVPCAFDASNPSRARASECIRRPGLGTARSCVLLQPCAGGVRRRS